MMNIGQAENSKQVAFLNDIRNVGMSIIFGECNADIFSETFEKYLDYVEKPTEYLSTIKKVYNMILKNECSPDDLLIQMGKHTKEIQYEDPDYAIDDDYDEVDVEEEELEQLLEDDNVEVVELTDDAIEVLFHILRQACEE